MGIPALITGLFGLAGAGISAASQHHTQAANASAQSELNQATMDFNRAESQKARDWQAAQAVIDRQFNSAQALEQRNFSSKEAALTRDWSTKEAAVARNFDAQQALLARQFEERMSSTAHQREVNDLRLAGLNPVLSATGGNGASTPAAPVIGAPMPSGASAGAGASASHSGSSSVAAAVHGLNAYMKKDVFGEFVNSALESMRVNNDYIKAKAQDKEADAFARNALTNAKRQIVDSFKSMAEITKIKSDVELNKWKSLSEEKQVELMKANIINAVRDGLDRHHLSEKQQEAVMISAHAAATAANAQAHMADIQDKIQSAESPERVNLLQKQADYWKSEFDKNKWVMEDPATIMQRNWWKNNEGAAGVKETAEIIGKVFHVGIGLHGITSIGPGSSGYQDTKIGF